jgi:vacuolar-type H+-ATPase subunit D/Vma8
LEARLQRLEEDVREVKTRVNGLIFVVLGAVIAQLVLRVVG